MLHRSAGHRTPDGQSRATCIRWFGARPPGDGARLRWVSKFDAVEGLLGLPHGGRTRCRASVNAPSVSRKLEGGTSPVPARLAALGRLAREGRYPVGLVIAPIMPVDGWELEYGALLDQAAEALAGASDVTVELITHRFTPGSKEVIQGWYPNTTLDLEEEKRARKFNKFGGVKYVYPRETMVGVAWVLRARDCAPSCRRRASCTGRDEGTPPAFVHKVGTPLRGDPLLS